MRIGHRTRLLMSLSFAALGVLVLVLWCTNRVAVVHEKTTPDRFDLGRVTAGSHLEVSVRLLTKGIRRLEFFRPSLIQVTDPSKARIIAPAPTQDGGFVAAASLANGGEIIVLTQSLWWHRLESATNAADNARLLRNLLVPEMEK